MGQGLGEVQQRVLTLLYHHKGGPLTVAQLGDLIYPAPVTRALLVNIRRIIHSLQARQLVDIAYVSPPLPGFRGGQLACMLPGTPLRWDAVTHRYPGHLIADAIRDLLEVAQTAQGKQAITAYLR